MEDAELKKVVETLLFITDHPLPPERLAQLCEVKDLERVKAAVTALKDQLDNGGSALQLMQIAGGWQMATRPENSIWVRKLYHNKMTVRLSQAALETLCIIAYRQPITRADIESIRGVEVIGPLDTLSERKLITVVGRRESVGRPILYGTTGEFLRQFGLNSLDDLPKLENMAVDIPMPPAPEVEPAQPPLFTDGQAASPEAAAAPEAGPAAATEEKPAAEQGAAPERAELPIQDGSAVPDESPAQDAAAEENPGGGPPPEEENKDQQ